MLSGSGCSLENSSLAVDSVAGGDDVDDDDEDVVFVCSDTLSLTLPSTCSVLW